jgi:hypothetical protein
MGVPSAASGELDLQYTLDHAEGRGSSQEESTAPCYGLFFGLPGSLFGKGGPLMAPTPAERKLQDELFHVMLEATFSLQKMGPDRETTLLALIRATEVLKERFEQELDELRQEKD